MADGRFDYFVILAEMRTGSNALAATLNLFDGISCLGEVFNPAFVGGPSKSELFGMDIAARERDPLALLERIKRGAPLRGFRFFHDHDPRVLDALLPDPRCAKIVLSRDPVEAYVSRKIAETTGQWLLTDARDRKRARIRFDAAEYEAATAKHTAFQARVRRALQSTGQTAFPVDHSEIGEPEVIHGLARFLGISHRPQSLEVRLKRQNPEPLEDKVLNPEALPQISDRLRGGAEALEPARGAAVRTWIAAAETPLLFLPMKGGPTRRVATWLAALDGVEPAALHRDFTQKTVRQWKNRNKDGRSFTLISHPVERAHRVFCRFILMTGPGSFGLIRAALRERYDVPLPEGAPGPAWDAQAHRAAFFGFLEFAKANNAGQTGLRSDPAWSSQAELLAGAAAVLVPDRVVREGEAEADLPALATAVGASPVPLAASAPDDMPIPLSEVYDDSVEQAVRALHNRDYMAFGFRKWRPAAT